MPEPTLPRPDPRQVLAELGAILMAIPLGVLRFLGRITFRQWLAAGLRVPILAALFGMYLVISVEGLKSLPKAGDLMGLKLHKKVIGCAWMADYAETKHLTVAHLAAGFLLGLTWWSWEQLMGVLIRGREATAESRFTVAACGLLTLLDGATYYVGLMGDDTSESPVAAVVLAVAWCLSMAVLALMVKKLEGSHS